MSTTTPNSNETPGEINVDLVDFFGDVCDSLGNITETPEIPFEDNQPARPAAPIQTSEGVYLDPETGEILEMPVALTKLGWTEMPSLPADASAREVAEFELKLDQVLDRALSYQDKIDRWEAAHAARTAPYIGAIQYWENFSQNMSKQLAHHRLKRFKKDGKKGKAGEFSEKTMRLPSGSIQFTKTGGWIIEDFAAVKKHIEEKVPKDKMAEYHAKTVIQVDYQKFLGDLKKEKYQGVPGTSKVQENPLGKVKFVSPKVHVYANDSDGREESEAEGRGEVIHLRTPERA